MGFSFKDILDTLNKVSIPLLLTVASALSITIFSSSSFAEKLAILDFREQYKNILGPSLLGILAILIAKIVTIFYDFSLSSWKSNQQMKGRKKHLEHMTPEEKGYLIPFILEQKNTVNANIDDGIMNGLELKGIVYRASNTGTLLDGCPFNLQPWARIHIEKNPSLLEGAVGYPQTKGEELRRRYTPGGY